MNDFILDQANQVFDEVLKLPQFKDLNLTKENEKKIFNLIVQQLTIIIYGGLWLIFSAFAAMANKTMAYIFLISLVATILLFLANLAYCRYSVNSILKSQNNSRNLS